MTWRDLEDVEKPCAGVVFGTLMQYVEQGASIDGPLVFEIINRSSFTLEGLRVVCNWLLSGEEKMFRKAHRKDAEHYRRCRMMVIALRFEIIASN